MIQHIGKYQLIYSTTALVPKGNDYILEIDHPNIPEGTLLEVKFLKDDKEKEPVIEWQWDKDESKVTIKILNWDRSSVGANQVPASIGTTTTVELFFNLSVQKIDEVYSVTLNLLLTPIAPIDGNH